MKPINIVNRILVVPKLPDRIGRLRDLAYNLWWTWDYEAIALFGRIDRELWDKTDHNPVAMLGSISQDRLEELADDDSFVEHMEMVWEKFNKYLESPRRYTGPEHKDMTIAYFSAEFGLTECISIYAGGLSVLAGDHLKSASDLGLGLVGVGILYREGYFRQYLNPEGWQQEIYPKNDFYNMPVTLLLDKDGLPLLIEIPYPERTAKAQVWKAQTGRISLYLLDANIEANSPEDRELSAQLYAGDDEMKIKQYILLGIGGLRALNSLGIEPAVCHMNEPHPAFLALERIRQIMQKYNCSFEEAKEAVKAGTVFTTHTPIPAGNERFPFSLVKKYLSRYISEFKIGPDEFLALGKETPQTRDFCQTVLAINLSSIRNGVSKLHGSTSRRMWSEMWPDVPVDEVPIGHISNGIHTRSWISNDLAGLYDRYLGPRWLLRPSEPDIWNRIDTVPDGELWRTHERRRERLVAFARKRLKMQLERRGAPPSEVALAEDALDPEALTIGFARRFATYKRAALILRDIERLSALFNNKERPCQIIFAGKAHPRDAEGKDLIKDIVNAARREDLRRSIVFIEDYDLNVARYLVQGCDVWLNTPLRPQEASGTSGMKAAANGALNLSIPDGWWPEGYSSAPCNGWTIGKGETYPSRQEQDDVESRALYTLLEKEVIPAFYERGRDGLPRRWIAYMKNAIKTIGPYFSSNRMVMEYFDKCYGPAFRRWRRLSEDNLKRARELTAWKKKLREGWSSIKMTRIETSCDREIQVGDNLDISAFLQMDGVKPEDIRVELLTGPIDVSGNLEVHRILPLEYRGPAEDKSCVFSSGLSFDMSGQQGLALRVIPSHQDLASPFDTGLILWADESTLVCPLDQAEKK